MMPVARRAFGQYVRFFGVLFLGTEVPFAVLAALALSLVDITALGAGHLLVIAAGCGVLFGLLRSVLMGIGQLLTTRRLRAGPSGLPVSQVQEVELDGSPDRVLTACAEALRTLPKTRVAEVNPKAQTIRAKRGLTWRSWGDEIRVDVQGIERGTSIIRVSSRPRLRTTLVDWGSNLRNVMAIRDCLMARGARSISADE
jgi:hypothetical protein